MFETLGLSYNILFQIVFISFVYWFSFNFVKRYGLSKAVIFLLVTFHIVVTILTSYSSHGTTTDAPRYFMFAESSPGWLSLFGLSTTFIKFLVYPLIHFLKLNYFSVFLIFSFFGIYGYLILYQLLSEFIFSRRIKFLGVSLTLIILFLPSFHFWMSFLGKDSITFMFLMLLLRDFVHDKIRISRLFFFVSILTFVRPYIGIFIVLSVLLVLFAKSINSFKKLCIITGLLVLGVIISFKIFDSLNIDIFNFFSERIEKLTRYVDRKDEGAFLNPETLSFAEKLFAYLYRPIFYDAVSISQLMISIENFFLFYLSIIFIWAFNFRVFRKQFTLQVLLMFCLLFLVVKAFLIYNLGIVNRQKYMIIPILIYVLYYFLNEKFKTKTVLEPES